MENFPVGSRDTEPDQHRSELRNSLGIKPWPEGLERFPKPRIISLDLHTSAGGGRGTEIAYYLVQVPEGFDPISAKEEFDKQSNHHKVKNSDVITEFRDWLLENGLAKEIEWERLSFDHL